MWKWGFRSTLCCSQHGIPWRLHNTPNRSHKPAYILALFAWDWSSLPFFYLLVRCMEGSRSALCASIRMVRLGCHQICKAVTSFIFTGRHIFWEQVSQETPFHFLTPKSCHPESLLLPRQHLSWNYWRKPWWCMWGKYPGNPKIWNILPLPPSKQR